MYDFTANIKSAIAEMIKAVLSALCIITSLFQCDISHAPTTLASLGCNPFQGQQALHSNGLQFLRLFMHFEIGIKNQPGLGGQYTPISQALPI